MVKCLNAFLDNNADYYLQYSNYMWEKFFDESVYSSNQKLRACYASKRGENRPMKLVEGTFKDSIVTNVDGDKWYLFRFEHKFKAPERNNQNCTVLTSDDVDGHRELLAMIKLTETELTNRGLWQHICCAMKDNGFEENDWLAFGEEQGLNMDPEKLNLFEKIQTDGNNSIAVLKWLAKRGNPEAHEAGRI
jgi:hypothetical protein